MENRIIGQKNSGNDISEVEKMSRDTDKYKYKKKEDMNRRNKKQKREKEEDEQMKKDLE
jgi:hypothetical protein